MVQVSMWRLLRRVVITCVGLSLILLGVPLLVLPGPGLLVIALGVAVLSVEYAWAQRLLGWVRERLKKRCE